jgi:hypothetical protein
LVESGDTKVAKGNEEAKLMTNREKLLLFIYFSSLIGISVYVFIPFWKHDASIYVHNSNSEVPRTLQYHEITLLTISTCFGVIGSSTLGISCLTFWYKRILKSWTMWYLTRPPIGAALAIIAYTIVHAGFDNGVLGPIAINNFGIAGISACAGLMTNELTARLRTVFNKLFGIEKHEREKKSVQTTKDETSLISIETNEIEDKGSEKSPGNEKIRKDGIWSPGEWQWILDKGGHIWVFFVGIFLFMITLIYYTQDTTQISTPKFAIATIAGSVIGSVFRGMVILKPMLKYELNWIGSFFIYIPIRGLIIGSIIFLVILAISLVFEVRNNISFLLIIVFFVSAIAYVSISKDKDDNYDLISDIKKKFSRFKEWIEGNPSPKEGDKQTVSDITKRYVIEYEQIKRFLYLIFPPLLILIFVFYNVNNTILLTMKILLFDIVVWWTLQIFSPLIRKDFRFYFAKACIDISEEKKSEAERTRYLILALESYNRYLRRYLKLQFNNAKKIYSKVSYCSSFDRDYLILSMKKTFKTNDELQPAFFISKNFLQIPESEQFLINEPLWQKVKDSTNFLVGIIPVGISLFELFSRYQ